MPRGTRLWKVTAEETLVPINNERLDFEERLENWLCNDISILSNNLLLIGRQVETDFNKIIDLLCLDPNGDLVILELKRDRTPRDIVAQVLDYASWVKDLSNERIENISISYLNSKTSLEEEFRNRFNIDLPETLNTDHSMVIVASMLDDSTERIVNYLSETYGININIVTFTYFKDENENEFLSKTY